jgi:hypothetical protein
MTQGEPDLTWKEFVIKYKKNFTSQEDEDRSQCVFNENMKIINDLNSQNLGYKVGVNRFSDMPLEDTLKRYTGLTPPSEDEPKLKSFLVDTPSQSYPDFNYLFNKNIFSKSLDELRLPSSYGN